MKKNCSMKTPKAKTPPAKRMAEGGDITNARTMGEAQKYVSRQNAGPMSELSRRVQGKPQQNRRIDDSPSTMAKNRKAARGK